MIDLTSSMWLDVGFPLGRYIVKLEKMSAGEAARVLREKVADLCHVSPSTLGGRIPCGSSMT